MRFTDITRAKDGVIVTSDSMTTLQATLDAAKIWEDAKRIGKSDAEAAALVSSALDERSEQTQP